ncbi:hypothetical protein VTG60DRAFT_5188 [Thermothelomyces hinnuleus]
MRKQRPALTPASHAAPRQTSQVSRHSAVLRRQKVSCFDRDWKPGPLPHLLDCCTCHKSLRATILMPKSMCKPCAWSASQYLVCSNPSATSFSYRPVCTSHMEGEERGWWRSRTVAETFTVRYPFLPRPTPRCWLQPQDQNPDSVTASAAALPNSRRSGIATLGGT